MRSKEMCLLLWIFSWTETATGQPIDPPTTRPTTKNPSQVLLPENGVELLSLLSQVDMKLAENPKLSDSSLLETHCLFWMNISDQGQDGKCYRGWYQGDELCLETTTSMTSEATSEMTTETVIESSTTEEFTTKEETTADESAISTEGMETTEEPATVGASKSRTWSWMKWTTPVDESSSTEVSESTMPRTTSSTASKSSPSSPTTPSATAGSVRETSSQTTTSKSTEGLTTKVATTVSTTKKVATTTPKKLKLPMDPLKFLQFLAQIDLSLGEDPMLKKNKTMKDTYCMKWTYIDEDEGQCFMGWYEGDQICPLPTTTTSKVGCLVSKLRVKEKVVN